MYDLKNKKSILDYAKRLINKSFLEVLQENLTTDSLFSEEKGFYKYNKGSLGHIIEKEYFGLTINSESRPDFEEAGIELKVSPYKTLKNGEIRAAERLVIGMIPFTSEIEADFKESKLFEKINLILFILYHRDKLNYPDPLLYPIDFVDLFSFYETLSLEDQKIIKEDYEKIQTKIKEGLAHELSEGDTLYLGACTKGATAISSYRMQHYNDEVLAKGRAFSFKQSFFSRLINDYIINKKPQEEKVIKDVNELNIKTFEDIVLERISSYIGLNESELFNHFSISTKSKSKYSLLAFRMLGVKSNSAEEFSKAGIVVKTIRIEVDNSIIEHMSFTNLDLIEFANDEWMDSYIYNFFRQTKFLFMIFKTIGDERIFKGAQFWNMPLSDINNKVAEDWNNTQKVIKEGVKFRKSGNRIFNNLPSPEETHAFHLRPKAHKSAYSININGEIYVRGNVEKDSSKLPNGDRITKHCFWLNRDYVIKQLKNHLID